MKNIKYFDEFLTEAEQNNTQENILYPLSTNGDKTIVLLPGAGKEGGQGGDDFGSLATTLGKGLEGFSVFTADFKNELNVRDYAKNIADEIEANDDIKQCAVGGFSIGGAIAWHLASALKVLKSEKFNNQLFFIDSGIPNSTEEFAEGIVKGNTPRIAMAQPFDIFIKNRDGGGSITPEEEKQILNFYSVAELNAFRLRDDVKNNYKEYMGTVFPPSTEKIEKDSNGSNPWIIEDKYDTTDFYKRYSVMPKEVESMTFKEGDVIKNRNFVEKDTLKKVGLGRETTPGGGILPPLTGVEVISLIAGNKEGKARPGEDIEAVKKEAEGSTTPGNSKVIAISGTEHGNITKSKELAQKIRELYFLI
jgi:pimeloyl-ACP methyl ester carboxylesterase